jgi:hypothetical protein
MPRRLASLAALCLLLLAVALWWSALPDVTDAPSVPIAAAPADPTERPPSPTPRPADADELPPVVECPYVSDGPPGLLEWVELDPDTLQPLGSPQPLRWRDGSLWFRPTDPAMGVARIEGRTLFEPVHVVWALGVCTQTVELPTMPRLDLSVTVDVPSTPYLYVAVSCHLRGRTVTTSRVPVEDGVAHVDVPFTGDCTAYTARNHGSLQPRTEAVPVRGTTDPQTLDLPPPVLPWTGLGAYVDRSGHVVIDAIEPDSPADRAGLRLRDRLIADGPVDDVAAWLDDPDRSVVELLHDDDTIEPISLPAR